MIPLSVLILVSLNQGTTNLYHPTGEFGDVRPYKNPWQFDHGLPMTNFFKEDPLHLRPTFLMYGSYTSGNRLKPDTYLPVMFKGGRKYLIKIPNNELPIDTHGWPRANYFRCSYSGHATEFIVYGYRARGTVYRRFFWKIGVKEALPVGKLRYIVHPGSLVPAILGQPALWMSPSGHYLWKANTRNNGLQVSYLDTASMKWHIFKPQFGKQPFSISSNFFAPDGRTMYLLAGPYWYKAHYGGTQLVKLSGFAPYAFLPHQAIKVYLRRSALTTKVHIVDAKSGANRVLLFPNKQALFTLPVTDFFVIGNNLEVMAAGQMRLLSIPNLDEVNVPPPTLLAYKDFVLRCFENHNIGTPIYSRLKIPRNYYGKEYKFADGGGFWPTNDSRIVIGTPDGAFQLVYNDALIPADWRCPCADWF